MINKFMARSSDGRADISKTRTRMKLIWKTLSAIKWMTFWLKTPPNKLYSAPSTRKTLPWPKKAKAYGMKDFSLSSLKKGERSLKLREWRNSEMIQLMRSTPLIWKLIWRASLRKDIPLPRSKQHISLLQRFLRAIWILVCYATLRWRALLISKSLVEILRT